MKVLLATDCSAQAAEAAEFLCSLGFDAPIDLTIVTALGDPYGSNPEATGQWFPELLRQEQARTESHHAELSARVAGRCRSVATVCQPGHPVKVILGKADELRCDLIVMGARGHSLIGRLLLGSVSDSVATHAKCSVLIARPSEKDSEATAGRASANHLVIGYDVSSASRSAVDELLGLGWDDATEIELVSVAPIYDYLLGNGNLPAAIANEEAIFKEMKRGGDAMKEQIDKTLPNSTTVVIHDQRVGDALVGLAKKHQSDLVVVGDSGHSLLDDFLLGSTSNSVLRHAETSVWVSRRHRGSET